MIFRDPLLKMLSFSNNVGRNGCAVRVLAIPYI